MKTYIVPIDFSATSINAAEYAALLSKQSDVARITLLHSYYISVYQSVLPTPDMVIISEETIEDEIEEKLNELKRIRHKLLKQVRENVQIDTRVSRSPLTRSVIENISDENADLVIIGSNGMNSESNSRSEE